jgi:hypothetical protein
MKGPSVQLLVMLAAAALEVGGDAMIRAGLRGRGWSMVGLGIVIAGSLVMQFGSAH